MAGRPGRVAAQGSRRPPRQGDEGAPRARVVFLPEFREAASGLRASRSGIKHGLLVPMLALVVTLVLAIVGAVVGASFIDQLAGVTLPGPMQNAAQGATQAVGQPQNLGTILSVSGILALLAPFVGGAIGGAWGGKTGRARP
jgi:hypothetical protein